MDFYYQEWGDGETCERCAAEIHSGWIVEGRKYGPTCGKVVLKAAGVVWPKKYGPGSFDPMAMKRAVELNRYDYRNGRWVHDYEARKAHKMVVGRAGWLIAQAIAHPQGAGKTIELNSEEALRCYRAAIK